MTSPAEVERRPGRASVVVPIYNSMKDLEPSLRSIAAAVRAHPDAEMVLVDHCSRDGSWEFINEHFADVATLLRVEGGTVATVRNRGAARATGEFLSFIDSDCVIAPDYLSTAIDVIRTTGAVATGSMVALPDDPHWIEDAWISNLSSVDDGRVRLINSGNLFVRADAFDAVGGFNERLVTGEDSELCQRLAAAGGLIYSARRVRAVHLDNAKSIVAFVRKEKWRGLGQLGTVNLRSINRPLAMTLTHIALTATVLLLLPGWGLAPLAAVGVVLASQAVVPALTVFYRGVTNGSFRRPLGSAFLFWLYYWARGAALVQGLVMRYTSRA